MPQDLLEDAGLRLQPAHILDDLIDVFRCDRIDLGHIPEFPVVRLYPIGRGSLESGIAMVIGFVDFVNQRRTLACADTACAMTGRTVGFELGFSWLQFDRYRASCNGLRCRLPLAAGRSHTENT